MWRQDTALQTGPDALDRAGLRGAGVWVLAGFILGFPMLAAAATGPAITVGTQSIFAAEIDAGVNLELTLTRFHATPSPADRVALRETITERLTDLLLLDALARAHKIPLERSRVDARYAAAARGYGGLGKFEKLLARAGMPPKLYRRQLGFQIRAEVLLEAEARAGGAISDAAIKAHFQKNPERYQLPASFHLLAALVKLDPGRLSEPGYRDTLAATAKNLAEKLRAGKSLTSLSTDYPGAEVKDLGFTHQGALVPEIAKALDGLSVGAVSAPVKALRGYYVVKLVAKKPPMPVALEKVRPAIEAELTAARKAKTRVRLLAEARKAFVVRRGEQAPEKARARGQKQ